MTHYIFLYLLTVPVFFLIDMVWLGFVARGTYQNYLGHLLGPINWPIAISFYLIYIAGIIFFAVHPAIEARSAMKALALGAFFGFFTYMTYDMTNWATIKDWPGFISIIDMAWGTFLGASVSLASYSIYQKFLAE